jgi:hypothetical protein
VQQLTFKLCLCSAVLSMGMPMQAGIIFDNGAPDQVYGDNMSEFLVAEDFSLVGTRDVSNIRYWSIQASAQDYRGSTYWAIYSNNAGTPDTILHGGVTAAVVGVATGSSTGFSYAEYVFNIPVAFQLTAGTYWLALHNGAISNGDAAEMLWSTTATGGGLSGVYTGIPVTANWVSTAPQEHAFLLEGSEPGTDPGQVPEPASIVLLASGLAFGAYLRRKR